MLYGAAHAVFYVNIADIFCMVIYLSRKCCSDKTVIQATNASAFRENRINQCSVNINYRPFVTCVAYSGVKMLNAIYC